MTQRQMGRITLTYRKQKSGIEGGTSNGEGTPICKKCGRQASHERCPAIGRICHKCQKQDHFQSMCKGKKSTKNTGSDRVSHGHIGFVEEVKSWLNNDPPGGEGCGADALAKAAHIPILPAREGQGVPMYWDHDLLKGVVSQQSSTRNGRLRYRRVLKNLYFDKSLGQFVE